MDIKRILGFLVLLSMSRSVLSGFCTEEVDCRKTCKSTLWFLKLFGIKWEFSYECGGKCNETKCCAGYEGSDCLKLTTDCTQNGKCLGHKYEEAYTDGCLCKHEVTMNQKFMGSNKRLVNGPCDTPCARTACSAGFTGKECNEKYDQDSTFLTQTELNSIKKQLEEDEGKIDEIYRDSEGYLTFGIGHLIRKSDPEHRLPIGTKISSTRIEEAFEADVHIAKQSILKIFPNAAGFPGEVKEILVNMAFNLGESRLKKFRKFIAAVNKADWSTAADEMVDSKWYKQVGDRAKRLVARMRALATSQGTNAEGDDSGCLSLSGSCQEDNLPCTAGYLSGLCSGPAGRRCCLTSSRFCSNVTLISRSQWGARSPTATTNINVPVDMFYIHHTDGNSCYSLDECVPAVRRHQDYHMNNNNWSDIGYSFLVGEDGNVYEGRGWNYVGAHTGVREYNLKSFAASFIGNYMTRIPGSKALQAVKNLISCGIEIGKIASDYELYGHRDVKETACPGDALYEEIQTWPHYSHDHP